MYPEHGTVMGIQDHLQDKKIQSFSSPDDIYFQKLGDYTYTAGKDPVLSGNCSAIMSLLGGGSVYGAKGKIKITKLTDTSITMIVQSDQTSEWLTLNGTVNGNNFDASLNLDENESGCSVAVLMRITGTFIENGFSGNLLTNIKFDCEGLSSDCQISDSYVAEY